MTVTPNEQSRFAQWAQRAKEMTPGRAFVEGTKAGADGNMLSLPFIAYEVGHAQRGEAISVATGRLSGLVTYPVMTGLTLAVMAAIPGVNLAATPFIAAAIASFPNTMLEDKVISGVRLITDTARQIRRLEFGGSYQDSTSAQAIRELGIRELTGTMQSSRRYLGQEAALLHR